MQQDSRRYATKIINKINEKVNWQSRSFQFIFSFLVALGLSYIIKDPSFTDGQISVFSYYYLLLAFGLQKLYRLLPLVF